MHWELSHRADPAEEVRAALPLNESPPEDA
jgi:hypothetical protein